MKILIAYASAGSGHRRAAEAMHNFLLANHSEIDVKLIDCLDYSNFLFKKLYAQGYSFLVSEFPCLWNLAYKITFSRNLRPINKYIRSFINLLNSRRFIKFVLSYNPQVILTTHFLPSEVVCLLKKNNKISSMVFTIITDYNLHPYWIAPQVDGYMVGCDYIKKELISEGVSADKIKVTGIPVDLKFTKAYDRSVLCEKLGIKKEMFTVLIVTAAFGLGPIEKTVDLLQGEVQILVVCGNNDQLYRKLTDRGYSSVKIFGFVSNLEELMAVSDVIITKPGGLTITESLAMELPMIFIGAIYGQETKNAAILEECRAGMSPAGLISIRDVVLGYKNNPGKLKQIRKEMGKIKKPFASREICAHFLPK